MFKSQRLPLTNELAPNRVAKFKDFHLSYCASSSGYGCDTTAIVIRDSLFLVLCGNHEKVLSEAVENGGLDGALSYFTENIGKAHAFSGHHNVLNGDDRFGDLRIAREVFGEAWIERIRTAQDLAKTEKTPNSGEPEIP